MPPDEEMKACYRMLEIEPGCSPHLVKEAYRELVKVWHPDRFQNDPNLRQRANAKLQELNHAFDLITAFLAKTPTRHQVLQTESEAIRSATEYRGDVELLTPNTIPHARNQDYLRAVSALGDGNRIRDTVFQHAHELSREKFSSWPLTAKFQARVINLCSKRYVRLELAKEIEYAREAKVSGEAIVRDRRIVLNAREATNLTPLFLLSIIHVRDLLTMPAHADLKPFCIRALKAFGYRNEGMFIKKDFFESEGSLAAEVAERTLRKFSEASGASGISGSGQ